MTVRVIGDKPEKTRQTVCANCGFRLEFTNADVKTSSGYVMGEIDVTLYIVCAKCKARVEVR